MYRNEYVPPVLIGALTTFIAYMESVPWVKVIGLVVSCGWFALACIRERRAWLEREDHNADKKHV